MTRFTTTIYESDPDEIQKAWIAKDPRDAAEFRAALNFLGFHNIETAIPDGEQLFNLVITGNSIGEWDRREYEALTADEVRVYDGNTAESGSGAMEDLENFLPDHETEDIDLEYGNYTYWLSRWEQ
jgi:hypothetical protein